MLHSDQPHCYLSFKFHLKEVGHNFIAKKFETITSMTAKVSENFN